MRLSNEVNEKLRELRMYIRKHPNDLTEINRLKSEYKISRNLNRRDIINQNPKEHIEILEIRNSKTAIIRKTQPEVMEKTYFRRIRQGYNLTRDEYLEMLNRQSGGCAICGSKQGDGSGRKLHLDHNHKIQPIKVRGLLCNRCNHLIGLAKDDITILEKSISYLKSNGL